MPGTKVLAHAGVSLADSYNIKGGSVGVEELDVKDVKGVHDMGATMFSERLESHLLQIDTGAMAQNFTWGNSLITIPDGPNRLVGLSVLSDTAARITNCAVSLRDAQSLRELPIWVWDINDDAESPFPWSDDGDTVAPVFYLRPTTYLLPTLLTRMGVLMGMPEILFRGLTAGFGAGTVTVFLLMHMARANPLSPGSGAPSAHGLPVPSW